MPGEEKPSGIVAAALIVVGLLIFVPSGLCSGLMIGLQFWEFFNGSGTSPFDAGFLLTVLIVGTPFILVGGGLLWLGVRRLRARRKFQAEDGLGG